MNRDDCTSHVGTLVRLATLLELEARRLGIDIEPHTHAITDKLRDYKHRKEHDGHQHSGH